jgi:hypothetical protein
VNVEETCSCGASFKIDGPYAVKLVREWRKKHNCIERDEVTDTVTSGSAQVETQIGFQANLGGLTVPARVTDPWEDE